MVLVIMIENRQPLAAESVVAGSARLVSTIEYYEESD